MLIGATATAWLYKGQNGPWLVVNKSGITQLRQKNVYVLDRLYYKRISNKYLFKNDKYLVFVVGLWGGGSYILCKSQ